MAKQFQVRDNSGVLFQNQDKDKANPAHANWADYRGEITVKGVTYWLNGWIKKDKNGRSFLSVGTREKTPAANYLTEVTEAQKQVQAAQPKKSDPFGDDEDSIPF